ncbi:MAG: ABC transporter substrate-binding protein [Coriobacteriia bacterium]|nr:ABC transporter substrate-binding protein [Coriobacteriia bacterium]
MRKHTRTVIALALCFILSQSIVLTGCQAQDAGEPAEPLVAEAETQAETQTIVDHAGRTIELPAQITTVYSISPVGTMLMYTFDDTMVAGLNVILSEEEKTYLTDHYVNLPHLGGWYGQGNQGNVEEIIKNAPDMVLSTGLNQSFVEQAEELQDQLGIPVVIVKDGLSDLAESYRFLGELFDQEARGEELARYIDNSIALANEIASQVPEDERVRVYYAEEQDGLHTDPAGSTHSQLIELCGGINVAECELLPGYGRTAVSIEQVLTWDPELIICCVDNGRPDSSSYHTVLSDEKWSTIQAVRDNHVYQTPLLPQNWFDRPPSVNTIIGIKWTLYLLYPDRIDFDIKQEAKDYYELFYHVKLTDKDVDAITNLALHQ